MLRIKDIQASLIGLIGWQQNYDTTDLKIADSLTKSESGLYFQQVHPLLTLQNMVCIAPDFKNIDYPEYSAEKVYWPGNIVLYNERLYKSIAESYISDKQPDIETIFWEETNPFSEWLEEKTKGSIVKAIMRYITEKLTQGTSKMLCENRTLFDNTGRLVDTIRNKNNFVGFEVVPIRAKGVTTKINKIGLQFTAPGEYTLYIMHSSMSEPIRAISLTKTKANSMEWFTLPDLYLPYQSDGNGAGGSWYIGYFQSELPEGSEAIRKSKDWSKEPCSTCSRSERIAWQAWSKYIEIHPFYINEERIERISDDEALNKLYLWDIEDNQYTYDTNYGLNLDISVECDLSDFIIEQRNLFIDVIGKQVAIDMLREFAFNPNARTNRHSINVSKTDILYELDGDSASMKSSGLSYQIDKAFKAIDLSTRGLDRVCLACKNNGIKYRVV